MKYSELWTAMEREKHCDDENNTIFELDQIGFRSHSRLSLCDLGYVP